MSTTKLTRMMRLSKVARLLISRLRRFCSNGRLTLLKLHSSICNRRRINRIDPLHATHCKMSVRQQGYLIAILMLCSQIDRRRHPSITYATPYLRLHRRRSRLLHLHNATTTLNRISRRVQICRRVVCLLLLTIRRHLRRSSSMITIKRANLHVRVRRILQRRVRRPTILLPYLFKQFNTIRVLHIPRPRNCTNCLPRILTLSEFLRQRRHRTLLIVMRRVHRRAIRRVHLSQIQTANRSSRSTLKDKIRSAINRSTRPRLMTAIMITRRSIRSIFLILKRIMSINITSTLHFNCSSLRLPTSRNVVCLTSILLTLQRHNGLNTNLMLLCRRFCRSTTQTINVTTSSSFTHLLGPLIRDLIALLSINTNTINSTRRMKRSTNRRHRAILFTLNSSRLTSKLYIKTRRISTISTMKNTKLNKKGLTRRLTPLTNSKILLRKTRLRISSFSIRMITMNSNERRLRTFQIFTFNIVHVLLRPYTRRSFLGSSIKQRLRYLSMSLRRQLRQNRLNNTSRKANLKVTQRRINKIRIISRLLLLFLNLRKMSKMRPKTYFNVCLRRIIKRRKRMILNLIFVLLFFLNINMMISIRLSTTLSSRQFRLLRMSTPITQPTINRSIVCLSRTIAFSTFQTNGTSIRLSSDRRLRNFLTSILRIVRRVLRK